MMEPVDWSKEPGYSTLYLPDGTEVWNVIEYDGRKLPTFENKLVPRLEEIKNKFESREGDILIYGFMKSGTHWLWEIIRMIVMDHTTVSEEFSKMHSFLESVTFDTISNLPSPRIFSTHVMPTGLASSMLTNSKVVVPIRNPKDTAVSMYHHLKSETKGTNLRCGWDTFINKVWFDENLACYATWHDFTSEAWKRCREYDNFYPIFYEQLLENPLEMIKDLGKFLGKDNLSDDRIKEIAAATSFQNMKSKKGKSEKLFESTFDAGYTMYRKGIKGDWRNQFTDEQSKLFDSRMDEIGSKDENIQQVMLFFKD